MDRYRPAFTRQNHRLQRDGQEQPLVFQRRGRDNAHRLSLSGLARTLRQVQFRTPPLSPTGAKRRVGDLLPGPTSARPGKGTCSIQPSCGPTSIRPAEKRGPRHRTPQPGGFTTKRHLSCDAHGRTYALALTEGQAGDCPQAPGLLRSHLRAVQAVLADRAYVRVQIAQAGAVAVIPGKKNRVMPVEHYAEICKERNQVERAINGLKRSRAVATRFDKRAANYFATCCLIAALTWL